MTESLKKYVLRGMLAPYILVYKKKNNMLVPVSSASRSYNSSGSKLNPELMNKYDVLKELNTQKVFLATVSKRKANEMSDSSDKTSAKKDLKK